MRSIRSARLSQNADAEHVGPLVREHVGPLVRRQSPPFPLALLSSERAMRRRIPRLGVVGRVLRPPPSGGRRLQPVPLSLPRPPLALRSHAKSLSRGTLTQEGAGEAYCLLSRPSLLEGVEYRPDPGWVRVLGRAEWRPVDC